jgi:DNA-binding response OmpR family regulator
MGPDLKKPPAAAGILRNDGDAAAAILAISPAEDDHLSLQRLFSQTSWRLYQARNYREALASLEKNRVSVIISECNVPPYNWRVLLDHLTHEVRPPRLVVATWLADDRLWAEVLDLGGFDVLKKPFEARELFRVVDLAWRNWKDECEPTTANRWRAMAG